MVAQNKRKSTRIRRIGANIGHCLGCGAELTYCGIAFSAEIECRKCRSVNIYTESKQPSELRDPAIALST